ncbi:MAG: conditioned medium factor [Lysobacteraceae bacterium]|nr:MAG: conditioned medium factor [Xanthomonadaceae bacterium]
MQPADPARAAVISKSALLPARPERGKDGGWTWGGRLPVEKGRVRFMVLAEPGHEPAIRLRSPRGDAWMDAKALAQAGRTTTLALGNTAVSGRLYELDGLAAGDWTLELVDKAAQAPVYVLLEGDPDLELVSYPVHRRHKVGQTQAVVAMLARSEGEGASVGVAGIEKASLHLTAPDGAGFDLEMFDDGLHEDGRAGDGVFGARFEVAKAGSWLAQVRVEGRHPDGSGMLRTAEHVIPVVEDRLALGGGVQVAKDAADRFVFRLPVVGGKASRHYRVLAEVWGRDAEGGPLPVAWIGGMSEIKAGALDLHLDRRWLNRSGAQGPFELRALRIEDPDHFVPLVEVDALALPLPVHRVKAMPDLAIDEAMRMGPRPQALLEAKGTGSRLLLVHGYCSGVVWPSSHFTGASTFLDPNKNRSHDAFARLIRDFGATWNSFGIVAHSQGGAAALHLYTYYWSGLDNAGPGRLIQSVGTPYQGTNLAGVLAALGGIFGVGCGSNDNLTYSGAAAWLAGIPSWARAKVNYYTTSFRSTYWWRNDYCNFASDLVLSDPEDGTVEKVYGQLSGGVNRGHTSGQCHTTGMRDPAQYLDASRNAVMNSNAAR